MLLRAQRTPTRQLTPRWLATFARGSRARTPSWRHGWAATSVRGCEAPLGHRVPLIVMHVVRVKQDPLGLDLVGIQAKRFDRDAAVQRQDIQAFVGALKGGSDEPRRFIDGSLLFGCSRVREIRWLEPRVD